MNSKETWRPDLLESALVADRQDDLKSYREQFYIPANKKGEEYLYLCGNSLGLQPKSVEAHLKVELEDWRNLGVEGHFHGKNPWFYYHHFVEEASARLVGAKDKTEVVVMNSLTVNLHLMLVSFYRPAGKRTKILIESPAFPSDQYAVDSQAKIHGYDPKDVVVEIGPREGEETIRTEDIIAKIEELGDELALVMFGGVNYYTGQFFKLKEITAAAHGVGANCGFDLAHAAGNLPLELHDWNVDFAVWCSYKYLNSGPGGTSGCFVHERHGNNPELVRMAGWWGNDEEERFEMPREFVPMKGAGSWQLSNAQVLSIAAHKASLAMFDEIGMPALRKKAIALTNFLEECVEAVNTELGRNEYNIISPKNVEERGCQLSILTGPNGKAVFDRLTEQGVSADWRRPNVIRVAPVPLYNRFEEAYRFASLLRSSE